MARESLKLKIATDDAPPTRVIADGRAIKVGDVLYSYDDDGLDCGFVMATDTKKREVRFYMLHSKRTITMTERALNEGKRDSFRDDDAGCWARSAEEAKRKFVERKLQQLESKKASEERDVKNAQNDYEKAKSDLEKFKATHGGSLQKRTARLEEAVQELRNSLEQAGPVGRKKSAK